MCKRGEKVILGRGKSKLAFRGGGKSRPKHNRNSSRRRKALETLPVAFPDYKLTGLDRGFESSNFRLGQRRMQGATAQQTSRGGLEMLLDLGNYSVVTETGSAVIGDGVMPARTKESVGLGRV